MSTDIDNKSTQKIPHAMPFAHVRASQLVSLIVGLICIFLPVVLLGQFFLVNSVGDRAFPVAGCHRWNSLLS